MLSRRVAKLVLALLLVVPLGAWVVLRVSLLIKVREAKALLSQVKALRVRESTFQGAKRKSSLKNPSTMGSVPGGLWQESLAT